MVAVKELNDSVDEEKPNSREYKAWKREKTALKRIGKLRLEHVMEVKAIISRAGRQYFMFPLANGGNLLDFIDGNKDRQLDHDFVKDIVKQLTGVAGALDRLHDYKHKQLIGSYRHGDLKPENILIHGQTWKITDLGLAKFHEIATGERKPTTTQLGGTVSYEPPEVFQAGARGPTTRLFDIWSMGCIILQLSIWLLDGYGRLSILNKELYDARARGSLLWCQDSPHGPARVHPAAIELMNCIRANQQRAATSLAVGDLLDLVQRKLLVVPLPPRLRGLFRNGIQYRANARELHETLQKILRRGDRDDAYWFSGRHTARAARNPRHQHTQP